MESGRRELLEREMLNCFERCWEVYVGRGGKEVISRGEILGANGLLRGGDMYSS